MKMSSIVVVGFVMSGASCGIPYITMGRPHPEPPQVENKPEPEPADEAPPPEILPAEAPIISPTAAPVVSVPSFAGLTTAALSVLAPGQTYAVYMAAPYTVKMASPATLTILQIASLNTGADTAAASEGAVTQYWLDQYRKNDTDYVAGCSGPFPKTFTLVRTGVTHTVSSNTECRAVTSDAVATNYFTTLPGVINLPVKFKADGRIQTLYGSMLSDCRSIPSGPSKPNCEIYEPVE